MSQKASVQEVPRAMRQDGWWLDAGLERVPLPGARSLRDRWRAALLVGLIAAGDFLVWDIAPGLSFAVFVFVILLAGLAVAGRPLSGRARFRAACGAVLCVLPLVELVQPLSVFLAGFGICAVSAMLSGVSDSDFWRASRRFVWLGPTQSVRDGVSLCQRLGTQRVARQDIRGDIMGWALPIVATLVFAALLIGANPVLDRLMSKLPDWQPPTPESGRIWLWAVLGVLIWPLLIVRRLRARLQYRRPQRATVKRQGLVNAVSVARSLVAFNTLFAVQTAMDIAFLYGHAALPDGISPAAYAHRGAYPLLITALLAGTFAVAARPYLAGRPLVRGLMMLWLGQTLALVFASVWRLDLYVEAYGLTRLRLAAFVWMGVVALGLGITAEQIWRDKPAAWMLRRSAVLGLAVLYLCAFLSFDRHIATYNLTRDVPEDREVLCRLGEAAIPAILAHTGEQPDHYCRPVFWSVNITHPADWREWGFRNWRVRHSLVRMQETARP